MAGRSRITVTASGKPTSGGRQLVKRAYKVVRHLPDRVLHGRRQSAVLRSLSGAKRPRRILVVCYGNVCRSPYLQAVLQRELPETEVMSAGFVGSGRAVPMASLAISARRGLDLSRFRSRPVTPAAVNGADLIIVMDPNQAREIKTRFFVNRARIVLAGDLDPIFEESRSIIDPWNQPSAVFEASFDRLDRCAAALVGVLKRPSPGQGAASRSG